MIFIKSLESRKKEKKYIQKTHAKSKGKKNVSNNKIHQNKNYPTKYKNQQQKFQAKNYKKKIDIYFKPYLFSFAIL